MAKIDFPYTVDDEPTEEWKVEQVLHWWLLRANSESEAEYETIVDGLTKQLAMGEQTLWEAHAQVTELLGQKNGNTDDHDHDNVVDMEMLSTTDHNDNENNNEFAENENIENVNASNSNNNNNSNNKDQQQQPDGKPTRSVASKIPSTSMSVDDIMAGKIPTAESIPTATATTTTTTTASSKSTTKDSNSNEKKKPDTIHIDVLDGFYGGTFYDLQPKSRIHAWVGRSQGKKFKQKGISLPKDLEISTTHGRFGYSSRSSGSGFSYTDVGSTNGSRLNGSCCEPNVSYALTTGMEILIGETLLKVTLLALA